MQLSGNVGGLGRSEVKRLKALGRRRVPPQQLVSLDLARELCALSRELGRQVGVLLDRAGHVERILVGDASSVEIPDLGRGRAGGGRLLGVRLVHAHLRGESLTRDDLTDLQLLRLDSIVAVCAEEDGDAGALHAAWLLPPNPEGEKYAQRTWRDPSRCDVDAARLIADQEALLARDFAARGRVRETGADGETTVLVGVDLPGDAPLDDRMAELRELARTAGLRVLETASQKRQSPDPRTLVGEGKLRDVVLASKQLGVDLVVFDRELTGGQMRNIAELTDQKVIDRTQLILDIFARHATSREGKLQVELAQLRYLLPRLTGRGTAMSRLAGGIGTRGPGETKLEMDRRRIRTRIGKLEEELARVASGQDRRRALRDRAGVPVVSIVGYTNAGKSSLLNRLTRSEELVENKLFATLDPRSRRLRLPREREILVTDTVGFIRDLPPELRRAFQSTLAEMRDADLLLHVVDASSEHAEDQMATVDGLLAELGLDGIPQLRVFNKRDAAPDAAAELARRFEGLAVSALTGDGCPELVQTITARLAL